MPVAREYLRVSVDKSGRKRSNEEQQQDNRATWTQFEFGTPYSDASSASRYATRARDDFDLLLADLTADKFGADVLVLWEGSRGSRKVGEWATLLDLCEARGVSIPVTEHDRIYDPAVPRDRKTLLEDAVDSEYESAKTSGRVRRAARANAIAGRPHGRILFGYRRVYDPASGNLLGQEPHPDQAAIVRRVFADYAASRSARSIATALNVDEVKTNRGNGWTALMVHRMIRNPAYKAQRVHQKQIVGPADWPALVDEMLWKRANDRHAAVAWKRTAYTASLLSGLVRCEVCNSRMTVHHSRRRTKASDSNAYYGCQNGYHAYRGVERLDVHVTTRLLSRLGRLDLDDPEPSDDPDVAAARTRLAELRADLDEAMACWRGERPGRKLSAQRFAEMETHLLPQIADCERRIHAAELAVVPLGVEIPEPDALAEWWVDVLDAEQRRAVMGAFVSAVVVRPTGRGRRHFDDADYTTIEWRR